MSQDEQDIHAGNFIVDQGLAANCTMPLRSALREVWRIHHDSYAPTTKRVGNPTGSRQIAKSIRQLRAIALEAAQRDMDALAP